MEFIIVVDGVGKSTYEQLNLLKWIEIANMSHASLECFLVFSNRATERKSSELGKMVGAQRWSKTLLAKRAEHWPSDVRDVAGIAFEHVELVLHDTVHVERRKPDFVTFTSLLGMKEVITPVQLAKWIIFTIKCGECERHGRYHGYLHERLEHDVAEVVVELGMKSVETESE